MANRRLERKVKDTMMQGEEEHNSLLDQKDQVCDCSQLRGSWMGFISGLSVTWVVGFP